MLSFQLPVRPDEVHSSGWKLVFNQNQCTVPEITTILQDLFHFEGTSYLLIVDYTSRFPIVYKLSSMTGEHVANQCKLIFSEYGWPETLISDNGPCYTSEAFTSLMKVYSVNHITSSPHYPQSNGLAEKIFQIVKSLFYKVKEEGKDMFKCLMIYHNTPLTNSVKSAMQILQSRSARSDLPMSNAAWQQLGLQSADKHKHLPIHDYHIGQDVMFQDVTSDQWYPATIAHLFPEPRSYNITTREGVNFIEGHKPIWSPINHKAKC